jgi:cell volume regulation protein A
VTDGKLILVAGALLAAGLAASLVAGRLRVPALVLFLGVGMAIGSDGTGWIDFADYELARTVGIIALALILFEGGLATSFSDLRPVLRPSISLAFLGTIATALATGVVAWSLFDLSLLESLLLGAILSATDGAAIFGLLRGSSLRRRLARTLEGEAGLNDPIAVLLVLGFVAWMQEPDYGFPDLIWLFARQLAIGAAVGAVAGVVGASLLRRVSLSNAGLYPVASITAAAMAFGAAEVAHGSGFLAVYLTGLILASSRIPARGTIEAFHQGAAWVAQIAVFLTLGLLVFPSRLDEVWVEGTVIGLVSIALARPLAVFVTTAFDAFDLRERLVLGWAGLRGAIPVVLATFPVIAGVDGSERIFDIVFFAVVISTVLQGVTVEPLARVLRVTTSQPALPRPVGDTGAIRRLNAELLEWHVEPGDAIVGLRVRELGLPRDDALVTLIVRDNEAVPPRGSSVIHAGDYLNILVRREAAPLLPGLFDRWRSGADEGS